MQPVGRLVAMIALFGSPALAQPKPSPPDPVIARILKLEVTRTCTLIDKDSEKSLPNGGCTIIRVDKVTSLLKVMISVEQAQRARVRFTP